jgi:hypothetical protein
LWICINSLINLSEEAGIVFDTDSQIFPGILMKYQLEGRYPDYKPAIPDPQQVDKYLIKTKELLQWLNHLPAPRACAYT